VFLPLIISNPEHMNSTKQIAIQGTIGTRNGNTIYKRCSTIENNIDND